MTAHVTVRFTPDQDITLASKSPMIAPDARAWLDAEYQRLECVPTRASGKVLIADKLLAVAQEVGARGFEDAAWAGQFANAAAGALDKAYISVDVGEMTVGF